MPDLPLERDARLEVEEERLRALPPFMFELSTFDKNKGIARGVIYAGDRSVDLRIFYGSTFPFQRPALFTDDDEAKTYRHVTGGGLICTLRYQPDEWDPERFTAAHLVKRAWKLVSNKGVLEAGEDDGLPEAVELTYADRTPYLLAPEDAFAGEHRYGRASLQVGVVPDSLVLTALRGEGGETFWQTNDHNRLAKDGAFKPEVVWFKSTKPLPSKLTGLDDLATLIPDNITYQDLLKSVSLPSISRNKGKLHQVLVQFDDPTGPRWAFVRFQQKTSSKKDKNRRASEWVIGYLPVLTTGPDAYFGRLDGLLERDKLVQAHVAIIGVGALGSGIAFELSRSGLGEITVFDDDTVKVGNPVRSFLPFRHLGKFKTDSLAATLEVHLPFTKVNAIPHTTASIKGHEILKKYLGERRFDLVVVAVGDHNTSRWLDEILANYEVPRLHTWATRGAAAGVVLVAKPGELTYGKYHDLVVSDSLLELPEDDVPYATERGCLGPVMPATPIDLSSIATHAARTTLDILHGNEVASLQVWSREGRGWEDVEVAEKQAPKRQTGQDLQAIPTTIRFSNKAFISMTKFTQESPVRETGGILLGECMGDDIFVHVATGPGKRSRRTKNSIVLDVEYAQGCIDTASAISNGKVRLLGEWHSHPFPSYAPSGKDMGALKRLADSPMANIDLPVIVIAGLNKEGDLEGKAYIWNSGIIEIIAAF